MIDSPSPNFDERRLPVRMVVLHYTGMRTAAAALDRLRDPEAKVSAHYFIAEDGNVVRLVPEEKRAWHAGRAYWRGIRDVNSASIGIELANPGHEWGYTEFPEPQIAALLPLLADIMERQGIQSANVVGHSDIAPDRKDDPGELFPWDRLARLGLAESRPKPGPDPHWTDAGTLMAMERFGYEVRLAEKTVIAFQRRWRPANVDGVIDGETRAILLQLLLKTQPESLHLGDRSPRA